MKFVSLNPYRIVVTGRVHHFISAFGEHVIAEEVEKALLETIKNFPETSIYEFSVAPQVNPKNGLPHHEWLIAFESLPNDIESFRNSINQELMSLNSYYRDLITGNILTLPRIISLKKE